MRFTYVHALYALALAGCGSHGGTSPFASDGYVHSYTIPSRHMPAPGLCRIWIPERSPVEQPPAGDCTRLRERVPAGAFLVRG